jgi:hypothetical protein
MCVCRLRVCFSKTPCWHSERVQLGFPYPQAFISEAIIVEELSVTMFEEGLVGL